MVPELEAGGWRVREALRMMRAGERSREPLLAAAGDRNSQDVVEAVLCEVRGTEAAGRRYPPQPRVDARPSVTRLFQSAPWRVCAHAKHPPKHQRPSYLPLQRLTPLQRSRKASLVDLNSTKLYVPEPSSDAMDSGSYASTLGDDWRHDAVSSSAYRTTTTKRARRRPPPRRRPVATPTRKRRAQAELSASSSTTASASSLAALPRTQEAMRKRHQTARRRRTRR